MKQCSLSKIKPREVRKYFHYGLGFQIVPWVANMKIAHQILSQTAWLIRCFIDFVNESSINYTWRFKSESTANAVMCEHAQTVWVTLEAFSLQPSRDHPPPRVSLRKRNSNRKSEFTQSPLGSSHTNVVNAIKISKVSYRRRHLKF